MSTVQDSPDTMRAAHWSDPAPMLAPRPRRAERHTVSDAPISPAAVRTFVVGVDAAALAATVAILSAGWVAAWGFGVALVAILAFFPHPLPFRLSVLNDAPSLLGRVAAWGFVYVTLLLVAGGPEAAARVLPVAAAAVLGARALSYAAVRAGRRRRWIAERVLVVGYDARAKDIARVLDECPEYGGTNLFDLGVHDDVNSLQPGRERLSARLAAARVQRLVLVDDDHGSPSNTVADVSRDLGITTYVAVPPGFSPMLKRSGVDAIWGHGLYRLRAWHEPVWLAKRAIDIIVSGTLLLLLAPVMALVAIGVKLSSRGPIIFKQPRVGRHGAPMHMWKFRTYPVDHVDAEWSLPTSDCPLWFGRFLRSTSIDELPQLVNIFRGDMSLVGPRPERPHFAEPLSHEIPDYDRRHRLPMGLTGLAQVNGLWGPTSIEDRVRFDNHYIEHWSLWDDIVILLRTLPEVLKRARAR